MPELVLSDPLDVNIIVYRGDSGGFQIQVKDDVGDPVDISTAEWKAEIRFKPDDTSIITEFVVTPTVGDVSKIDVKLTAESSQLLSKSCVWDIQMIQGDNVLTIAAGTISPTKDVTRPT